MSAWLILIPALALLPGNATFAPDEDERDPMTIPFEWMDHRKLTLDEAPPPFSFAHEEVIEVWGAWALENEYRLLFTDDTSVLFLTDRKSSQGPRRFEQLEVTLEYHKLRLLAEEPLDEDAWEDHLKQRKRKRRREPEETQEHPDIADCVVLLECKKLVDYTRALDHIAEQYPRLRTLLGELRESSGFALPFPLVGAWQESPAGAEEWNATNELVNRLTQLCITRDFGPLPRWATLGAAWYTELDLLGSVYCFPYRNEFVGVGEHAGWENILQRTFSKRKDEPLRIDELASCRKEFDSSCAGLSWGATAFLMSYYPGTLPSLLDDLREKKEEEWPPGVMIPEGEVMVEAGDQLDILRKHTRQDVLEQISEFFRKGDRYRFPED